MARRRGRRKDGGLLDLALESGWQFSLALCIACLLGREVFHAMLGRNPFAPALFGAVDPLATLLAVVFGALAVIKFFRSRFLAARAAASASHVSQPVEPTFHVGGQVPARGAAPRDPGAAAFIAALNQEAAARPLAWSLAVLRDMEWKRFEDICLAFYRAKGIRAESTPLGPDGGVDVRLYQAPDDPARCTAIVQRKAWGERYVGVKPVRELRGVMAHEEIDQAFFMAPGAYSDDAKAFASENRITLIDGPMFLAMLQRLAPEVSRQLLAQATAGDWTTPTCPHCGIKMVERNSQTGKFWGCQNYPRCRQI